MKTRLVVFALTTAMAAVLAAPAAADELSPEALLARYQPATVLSQGERFAPTSVDDFLADASLQLRADDGSFQPETMPQAGLPVHGEGWRLDHRCPAIGGPLATVVHLISLACYPPQAQQFFQLLGIPPHDVAVPGAVLGPGTTAIEAVQDQNPRWLRFPGTWGEAQYIAAPPFGVPPTAFGTSPIGPAFQDYWLDPLGAIADYPMGNAF